MVGVAQLVERRIVIPVVVGSNPIVHPNFLFNPMSVGLFLRAGSKRSVTAVKTNPLIYW